jgi:hypothetical protein
MFQRRPPAAFPDVERTDLSLGHQIEWQDIVDHLKRGRRQARIIRTADILGGTATLVLTVWAVWALAHWPHH